MDRSSTRARGFGDNQESAAFCIKKRPTDVLRAPQLASGDLPARQEKKKKPIKREGTRCLARHAANTDWCVRGTTNINKNFEGCNRKNPAWIAAANNASNRTSQHPRLLCYFSPRGIDVLAFRSRFTQTTPRTAEFQLHPAPPRTQHTHRLL